MIVLQKEVGRKGFPDEPDRNGSFFTVLSKMQMALHLSVGNVFMPIVCGLYLINGIISLRNWGKLYKKNA